MATSNSCASSPPPARVRRAQLAAHGAGATHHALLKASHYLLPFKALLASTVTIDWYGHAAGQTGSVLVASGARTFHAPVTRTITITLTAKGRQLLKRAHRVITTAHATVTTSTTRV